MRKIFLLAFIVLSGSTSFRTSAQTTLTSPTPAPVAADAGIKANLAIGEVTAVNQTDNKILLQTKDGAIDVVLTTATAFKKVSPENPKLTSAADAAISDIGVGDKILVTGTVAADKKSVPAKTVYLMTKADITKKNTTEREAWKTRGISGRIVSLNPNKEEFTIASRGMTGEQKVVVSAKDKADYRRYAPDSVKFDDAKNSSFSELKIGDQIRALGDKSADNTTFKAERIVSGAFKMVGGTITAIDTAKNEITIKELQTDKPVTIVVNQNSILRKFPAEMAAGLAAGMATRMQGTPPSGGQGSQTASNGMPPGDGGMRGGRVDLDDMLERLPVISFADLKIGDAIGVSSSSSADTNRYTAIKLVSGVEPFFKASQTAPGGAQRGGGGQPQINIPGLDGGIGNP